MPYCSLTDLANAETSAQLIQLTDDEGSGAVNTDRITAAVTEADSTVDAYLRGKVAMPAETPAVIRQISVELAVWNLYRRRMGSNMPESVLARKKDALRMLGDVASGVIRISQDQADGKLGASAVVKSPDRTFDDETLDQY